jgi:hypothetical protein
LRVEKLLPKKSKLRVDSLSFQSRNLQSAAATTTTAEAAAVPCQQTASGIK